MPVAIGAADIGALWLLMITMVWSARAVASDNFNKLAIRVAPYVLIVELLYQYSRAAQEQAYAQRENAEQIAA